MAIENSSRFDTFNPPGTGPYLYCRLVFSNKFVKLLQRVSGSAGHIRTLQIAALRDLENLLREPP
jgi:hypothetical protein